MNLRIEKTDALAGTVYPPSSKSHSVRALLIAAMAKGVSEITSVLDSEDTAAALDTIKRLGAKALTTKNQNGGLDVEVESFGIPLTGGIADLYTGNSGITTRFVLPLLGLRINSNESIVLDCGEQMKQRPLQPLVDALNHLGMQVEPLNNNGTCPLKVSGRLLGGKAAVDGATSQYISALLLSLPLAPDDSEIIVPNLHERPYVEMTTRWLHEQGIKYEWKQEVGKDVFYITGRQQYGSFKKTIPGDFSSASYLLAAGALLQGEVTIVGLDMNDPQGDKKLIAILKDMGADISISEQNLIIKGGKKLRGIKIDCNEIPDLVPTLAVLGTYAGGKTEITNVPQARLKETDRLNSMAEGLVKLGARVEEKPDGLVVYESKLHGAAVNGYNDHRTVMALALAGMIADGTTVIDTAEAINKTFPTFIKVMRNLGAKLSSCAIAKSLP